MGKYFTVYDQEYQFPKYTSRFDIEVERSGESFADFSLAGVGIEFFDENGNSIAKQNAKLEELGYYDGTFPTTLVETSQGQVVNLPINLKNWPNGYAGAKTFTVTMISNETDSPTKPKSGATKSSKNSSSSNPRWDKALDNYEKAVDQYARLYKKAMAGDMSAMSEYAEFLESATKLQNELSNAGDLSPAQASRLAKIASKMAGM